MHFFYLLSNLLVTNTSNEYLFTSPPHFTIFTFNCSVSYLNSGVVSLTKQHPKPTRRQYNGRGDPYSESNGFADSHIKAGAFRIT